MLVQSFSDGLCISAIGSEDPRGIINKDEITDQQSHQPLSSVAEVICSFPASDDQREISNDNRGKKKLSAEHKGRVRWTSDDTLTLVNAKLGEKNTYCPNDAMKKTKSAIEKWRSISAHCHENGLDRNATQCRDRWKHILPDYKKIRHYERNLSPGQVNYWNMTAKERMDMRLPNNYTRAIYDAMGKHFVQKGNDAGDMIIDTSASDHVTFDGGHTPKLSIMHDNLLQETLFESPGTTSDKDKNCTRKRRKMSSKGSGVKTTLSEGYKMIMSNMKVAEEGRMKRHERYCNLFERRMEMDEKYLSHHAMSMQRMIQVEEQKVKAQHDLAEALNTIGQAIFKIYESFDR